jgi:trehalose synthase
VALLQQIEIARQPIERFESVVGAAAMAGVMELARESRELLSERVFWNVNSTGLGGGVAEMLRPLVGYARGLGIDARWLVIQGSPEFYRITKRLHHALHGSRGDGTPLDGEARRIYEQTLHQNAVELADLVRPGDVVLLHDPQTAGLAPHLVDSGATLVWRCHIGHDEAGEEVNRGWRFLAPYLEAAPAYVFSRQTYIPEICDHGKSTVIRPSIDAFSPKNQELSELAIQTILVHTGLVEGPEGPPPNVPDHCFVREDSSPGRVERRADVLRHGRAPDWNADLVVQVSRWDPLKDPLGVMEAFSRFMEEGSPGRAELVLAGPNPRSVSDDPEGEAVFDAVIKRWSLYPTALRNRIHIAALPTDDVQENAAIVNALQRHASVVVQKSLQEGFGLTVTEAMWKHRAVVASAVGGIQDQIEHGVNGLLLSDPTNLDELASALHRLLKDPSEAARLGQAAHERVAERFLGVHHLVEYGRLLKRLE